MLSEKIRQKERITDICKKDHTIFKTGTVFRAITVLDADCNDNMLCGPVIFHGYTDRGEMLLGSGDGRYYFSVCDGWGVEDNCLYALSIGAICRDFKKAVTAEDIEFSVNHPKEPKSTYSALAIGMKLKDDKEILKVLQRKPSAKAEQKCAGGIDVSKASTAQLAEELSKRAAVQKLTAKPYEPYQIAVGAHTVSDTGPAVILRIWD